MDYMDKNLSSEQRADLLLSKMTLEEKIMQLQSQMVFFKKPEEKRDYRVGNVRNIGHFMKYREKGITVRDVANALNDDTRHSMEANRYGIPVLQNGEALHGANWGNATCFPAAISMASMFDDEMIYKMGTVVAKELRAVGVRHVFAPVVNLVRDCRWGRTEESYGEDVCLVSHTGAAYCRGLEDNGIMAAPKHFVDNYGEGGRDSNFPHTSWRTQREVYMEPFRACFQEGHAHSVMMAYNAVDGVPCTCNRYLIDDVLRKEWGFDGVVISDYNGVRGIYRRHEIAEDIVEAQAMSLKAGLDVSLPNGYRDLKEACEKGMISEEDINKCAKRVLKWKFELGLFDEPFVDPDKAVETVRCAEHRELALKAAEKGMVLLKNNGLLPLEKNKIHKIGLFGPSAVTVNIGGYSGGYYDGWWADDALTPYQAIKAYLGNSVEVICHESDEGVTEAADQCDVALYFSATLEGEGSDRCNLKLPNKKVALQQSTDGTLILEEKSNKVTVNQEKILQDLLKSKAKIGVVLINGAPIEVAQWEPGVDAVLEAWYPGEQGSAAIVKTLFGENNPGGKLPITFPLTIGQLPLYYSHKPTGRGMDYIENDGKPYYSFGFGLSYTKFEFSDFKTDLSDLDKGHTVKTFVTVTNVGDREGDEVVQLYIHGKHCGVVRPVKELKAYKRITLKPGESKVVELDLTERDLSFWDAGMNFGIHPCDYEVMVGNSSDNILFTESFKS